METYKKVISIGAVIVLMALFLFVVPMKDGEPLLTVGDLNPMDSEGIGGLGGDVEDIEDNRDKACMYPQGFPPITEWRFKEVGCPDSVNDFFSESLQTNCFSIEGIEDVYESREDITDWYDDFVQDLGWIKIDSDSGYVKSENCWVWGTLYYCDYNDIGMLTISVFRQNEETPSGRLGQTVGDWDYISGRAEIIDELVDELID